MDLEAQKEETDAIPVIKVVKRQKSADFSKGARLEEIQLRTNAVQIVFEHTYSRADNTLFAVTKQLRRQGRIAAAKAMEKTLTEMFDTFSSELSEALEAVRKTFEEQVPASKRNIVYNHVRTLSVPASNGYASRLINITLQLDTLASTIDGLEINNVLSPDLADQTTQSWIKRYRRFTSAIQALRAAESKKNSDSSVQTK